MIGERDVGARCIFAQRAGGDSSIPLLERGFFTPSLGGGSPIPLLDALLTLAQVVNLALVWHAPS